MENIALIGRPTIEEGREDVVGEVDRLTEIGIEELLFRELIRAKCCHHL